MVEDLSEMTILDFVEVAKDVHKTFALAMDTEEGGDF